MPPRPIQHRVVVITGASSGIGRATARAFAARRASIVLAARREHALNDVARECHALGASAIAIPTDVIQPEAVAALARAALENFGRIDVWFNNAAVSLFARFEEAPIEAFRRVIETNLWGYIHCARATLPIFREQGRGVLINNASIAGCVGQPFTSAYVASKFAIRGLSQSLRQELRDAPGVRVCTLLPASIDTPIFQQAGNYTGRVGRPIPPVYDASEVASAVVRLSMRPQRELIVGTSGVLMALQARIAPAFAEMLMGRVVERRHFEDRWAPASPGNLFEPMPELAHVSGGWKQRRSARPPHLLITLAAAVAFGLLGFSAARRALR